MKVSTHKVLYGHHVVLTGRVWGRNHAGREVTIEARVYGSSAPRTVALVVTAADGRWSFGAAPRLQTAYQARLGALTGPRITIGVAPAVAVASRADGTLHATVRPADRIAGRFVQLQARSGGHWTTVDRRTLSRSGAATFEPQHRNATLRVAMSINQAGAGLLGAASHALLYRPLSVQLAPS